MLKQTIKDELKKSMLAKDADKTSVLRMLISAIGYYEIQKGGAGYEATDEDILSVIQKEVKQRKDSIEQYKSGGRDDLVDKESKELEILKKYLPEQMSDDEIKEFVRQAIEKTGAANVSEMGRVMAEVIPHIKGKADGSQVSKLVKELLTQ